LRREKEFWVGVALQGEGTPHRKEESSREFEKIGDGY